MGKMVGIDEHLLVQASEAAGTDEAETVVAEALRSSIARETTCRLVAPGGTMPGAWVANEGDEPLV